MEKKVYEFISNKSGEKIIEWKKCRCGEEFPITDKDLEFYDKISPVFGGKKYSIPIPTLCPDCRQQRRLSFRNERKLYKRKCDLTGKEIISVYSLDKPFKVYGTKEWWSDKWNPLDYGKDFDFNKSFFEQFNDLLKIVPQPALSINANENSDYTNEAGFLKNCYLVFESGYNNDCYYSNNLYFSEKSFDNTYSNKLINSYFNVDCINSSNVYFSKNLEDCNDCYGCYNIKNKSYNILNKQYSKEDYYKNIIKFNYVDSVGLENNSLKCSVNNKAVSDCSGDNISFSSNCNYSYDLFDCNKMKYAYQFYKSEDCYDVISFGDGSKYCYDSMGIGTNTYRIMFSKHCYNNISNIIYSDRCLNNSSNLFGCIGLRNKEYCIFNKQYSKEDYEILVPKIIEHMKKTGEWGEFFPVSISPFGYNETVASEYFPLSREEVVSPSNLGGAGGGTDIQIPHLTSPNLGEEKSTFVKGLVFNWSDYEAPFPKVDKVIPTSKLPDNIKDIPDDILNWAIECEVSKKLFRIIKQELEFYRKHGLPIPRKHPDVRHMDRMKLRNPRKLFLRKCDKCSIEMISVYDKDSEYKIYCEDCYNKEVY